MPGPTGSGRFADYTGVGISNEDEQAQRTRRNGLMANGSEQTQQNRGNGFNERRLQSVWAPTFTSGNFPADRDAIGSGRDIIDTFPSGPSGSGALAASSDANVWGSRPSRWSSTDNTQARALSGNGTPSNSRSDAASRGLNGMNGNSYYPNTSTIAQRNPVGSRPATVLDPPGGAFRTASQMAGLVDDNGTVDAFGHFNLGSQRPGQEQPFFNNAVGSGASRDSGESDLPGFNYAGPSANAMHSQRPSLVSAASFGTNNNGRIYEQNNAPQTDEGEVSERLERIALESDLSGSAYHNRTQSFQLKPVSQPWENAQAYQNGFPNGVYGNGTGFERRGSAVDRSSSAGSTYRTGMNSPGTFAAPPAPNGNSWSRPASQGHRMGPEAVQQAPSQQFLQQYPASLYQQVFYHPDFQHYYNFRQGPMTGYPPSIPAFLGPGGVPLPMARDQDPGRGVRSVLLEEFRSSSRSASRYELRDIRGHVVEFCGDQAGSRFIQTKLPTANSDEKEQVFREIEPNAVQLAKDVFGNYVIQRFFEHGNQVQKKILADRMKGKVVELSKQKYACRVVQKALEHVLVEQQVELAKELEPEITKLILDCQGNHVVHKVLEQVPREHLDFVYNSFRGRVSELAVNQYGCRLIQQALSIGNKADRTFILEELRACAHILPTDQFGNYVSQHVISKAEPEERSRMIQVIMPMVVPYSKQKVASNVVETCIVNGTLEEKRAIRDQILKAPGDGANRPLFQLMKDAYGNYVLQKLLNELQGEDREVLAEQMRPHLAVMRAASGGKKDSTVERLAAALSTPVNGTTDHTPEDQTPALTPATSLGSPGRDQ